MQTNISTLFHSELNSGERIVWSGQPQQGFFLRPADAFLIPFSLMWGGFALFWEFGVVSSGAPFFFMLWGIPFVLIGLYVIFGRFFVDIAQRRKIYYALTNERVIIVSGLFNRNIKSLKLATLSEVNITEKSSGKGTITFGPTSAMSWMYSGGGWPMSRRMYQPPTFEMIEDVRMVYNQMKRLQNTR